MTVDELYPIVIVQDRYHGQYSGGAWLAIALADSPLNDFDLEPSRYAFIIEDGPNDEDDTTAMAFWAGQPYWIAAANDPTLAVIALLRRMKDAQSRPYLRTP